MYHFDYGKNSVPERTPDCESGRQGSTPVHYPKNYSFAAELILCYNYHMKKIFNIPSVSPEMVTSRATTRPPSRVTPGGSTALKEVPKYTGTEMIGISIIHKSCLKPVFSKEAAIDVASMRR